jgi:L-ascorbate metabolism protein UlaG (beta-lactamase superfamily)
MDAQYSEPLVTSDTSTKQMRRRTIVGGASVGLAGLGITAYKAAPGFWQQFSKEVGRPIAVAPQKPAPGEWPDKGLYAAWLGHSTVLLKIDGFTILTDPVFSDRVGLSLGPLTLGLKRMVRPALEPKQIPTPNLILLSHAHMDHMDLPSLRRLENRRTGVVMASRTSDLLRVKRFGKVQELAWGEKARAGPVRVQAFEVNHWGARVRTDTFRGYNGYLIDAGRYRILFAGDTAMTGAFRNLKSSKPVDLAIMPVGAYNPWIRYHCTPEQAWRMGNDAGAEFLLPVHHQTFQLGRESFYEPIERFHRAAGGEAERIAISEIGAEFKLT